VQRALVLEHVVLDPEMEVNGRWSRKDVLRRLLKDKKMLHLLRVEEDEEDLLGQVLSRMSNLTTI
jgi:hypothetical protein